jgi:hypothetical protein
MRVLCKTNSGRDLSGNHFESGYTPSSEFDLEIGKEYVVYGICIWKGFLTYLIMGEGLYPYWYPSELFSVTRNDIPPDWYFAHFSEKNGVDLQAIWGYYELISADEHFDELSNLEKRAIGIFMARQKQIDEIS